MLKAIAKRNILRKNFNTLSELEVNNTLVALGLSNAELLFLEPIQSQRVGPFLVSGRSAELSDEDSLDLDSDPELINSSHESAKLTSGPLQNSPQIVVNNSNLNHGLTQLRGTIPGSLSVGSVGSNILPISIPQPLKSRDSHEHVMVVKQLGVKVFLPLLYFLVYNEILLKDYINWLIAQPKLERNNGFWKNRVSGTTKYTSTSYLYLSFPKLSCCSSSFSFTHSPTAFFLT
jgi:hypothetical protein